jgi:hypothetical protein
MPRHDLIRTAEQPRRERGKAITKQKMKDQNMKMKTKFILNSLADLPACTLALAASVPLRAIEMTKRALTPPVRARHREVRAARQRSANLIKDLSTRANAPLAQTIPWAHGGLND